MRISLKTIIRGLGVMYLLAFLSFAAQVMPLFGSEGITPISSTVSYFDSQIQNKLLVLPSLFWLGASDGVLLGSVWLGVVLSGVMILGRRFSIIGTVGAWLLYLSFINLGMPFMSFQWDILLVEAGFLAILVECGVSTTLVVWAFRLLVLKVMFASGVVKLASGDPLWRSFDALSVHYLTQPIAHIGGWYAHRLPAWLHALSTIIMFGIELVVPFFMFGTKKWRQICAASFIGLMGVVALTGNYTFFNMLMILLSLSLLIDVPTVFKSLKPKLENFKWVWIGNGAVVLLMAMSIFQEATRFVPGFRDPLQSARQTISGWRMLNTYGLFAVMTPHRDEISIQGSYDGKTWTAYPFKYKPEALNKAPQWVWPHQPRLDWQMWFAALSTIEREYWLQQFAVKLLQGNTVVTSLLEHNPFAEAPATLIRMERYRYDYTTLGERQESGNWWKRRRVGAYCFPVTLPRRIPGHE